MNQGLARLAPRFVLVAGEPSGDALAAGLIHRLRGYWPDAVFEGVTGPLMRAAGCTTLADMQALSLFGVSEVVGEIPRLLRLRRRLIQHVYRALPAAFIGVDAPAFNTGLERRLRAAGVATVHYVCPTVWAWRAGRTRSIRRAVDLLLAIFPFEPALFAAHGIDATFVGHPLADETPLHVNAERARSALDLDAHAPLVGLLPGSRVSEVSRLGPRFIAAARWLAARYPRIAFVAPMATPGLRRLFESQLAAAPAAPSVRIIDGRSREVMRAADVLLLASGTASLEALLAKTPMVVAYCLSAMNYWLVRTLDLIKSDHVSMPNLLAGRSLVPELLQDKAEPAMLGAEIYRLLTSRVARAAQTDAFEAIHRQLAIGADARAAGAVVDLLARRGAQQTPAVTERVR